MTILNISIFTFLIGLGLFSYTIYERSSIISSGEQKPKTENLNYKNDNTEILWRILMWQSWMEIN